MNEETFDPEEHPWLDVPDDSLSAPTVQWTPTSAPFSEQGGPTLPAFMIESDVITTPQYSAALRRQQRALAIYSVSAVLALFLMCGMFFVLGGRFAPDGTPHLTFLPSRASVGGQTGATPTATPAPTNTPAPLPVVQPTTPTPTPRSTPAPVTGIRPVQPGPLPKPTVPPAAPPKATPTPPAPPRTPAPTATSTATATPAPTAPAATPLPSQAKGTATLSAPATLTLPCHPVRERVVGHTGNQLQTPPPALTTTLTFTNTSTLPERWSLSTLAGPFRFAPSQGTLQPGEQQIVALTDITSNGALAIHAGEQQQRINVDLC